MLPETALPTVAELPLRFPKPWAGSYMKRLSIEKLSGDDVNYTIF
jgi:hypothetical protein